MRVKDISETLTWELRLGILRPWEHRGRVPVGGEKVETENDIEACVVL